MKAGKLLIAKHYKQHKNAAMKWICRLFLAETLQEIDQLEKSIIIMTNCQQTSKLVEEQFQNLIIPTETEKQINLECSRDNSEELKRPLVNTKLSDSQLEKNSPFFDRYCNFVQKFRSSAEYQHHLATAGIHENSNHYYSERFCDILTKTV